MQRSHDSRPRTAAPVAGAVLVGLVVLCLLAAAGWGAWGQLRAAMNRPGPGSVPVRIQVPEGARLRSVLDQLRRDGALQHPHWVELYLRLTGRQAKMQAGLYQIAAHATPSQILEQFAAGRVLLSSITFVEGWTVAQMRQALDSDPDVAHQTRGLSDEQLMQVLGHPGEPAEGRFFPDTYRFAAGISDRKILGMAYQRMQATLAADWAQRAGGLPLAGPGQALILASIIEKETGRADERPKIAAVFVNRLRLGMRLQSDPTVIYGLGEHYDGSIHTRDLQTDTPYNTYTRAGLPPTPIALPGAASLQAAMHPADIDALYFVATGEGDGSHHFSATLAEHDVALRSYLKRLGVAAAGASISTGAGAAAAQHTAAQATRP